MNFADRLIVPIMKGRGQLTLPQIYRGVRIRARTGGIRLTKHWRSTIRNTLQRHCKENRKFCGEARFKNHTRGVWSTWRK
jgi:hypothetical protein